MGFDKHTLSFWLDSATLCFNKRGNEQQQQQQQQQGRGPNNARFTYMGVGNRLVQYWAPCGEGTGTGGNDDSKKRRRRHSSCNTNSNNSTCTGRCSNTPHGRLLETTVKSVGGREYSNTKPLAEDGKTDDIFEYLQQKLLHG